METESAFILGMGLGILIGGIISVLIEPMKNNSEETEYLPLHADVPTFNSLSNPFGR